MLTATHILIGAAISAAWVASLYVHPFGRCIRCHGKRVIIRGKPRKAKPGRKPKMPRTVTCPLCKGVGRRQRFGSRTVNTLARRVQREIARNRKNRQSERTSSDAYRNV
jgi:hypothetical protein